MSYDEQVRVQARGAAARGDLGVLKACVSAAPYVATASHGGETPMFLASAHGHLPVVKYLHEVVGAPATSTTPHVSPLGAACKNNHVHIARFLIEEAGVPVADGLDAAGSTVLVQAAARGCREVVRYLLEGNKVPVEQRDLCGSNAVLAATKTGDVDTVQLLVEAGASVSDIDAQGCSLLLLACDRCCLPLVRFLIEHAGANVAQRDFNGFSALHVACDKGNMDIVSYLCQAGAEVDATDKDGDTPLMIASMNGHCDVVQFLIENAGSDPFVTNRRAETCFRVAFGPARRWLVQNRAQLENAMPPK